MLSILIIISRSVNRLVLQGNNVRVVTHTPLGGTRSVTVAISDVSCTGSRIGKFKVDTINNYSNSCLSTVTVMQVYSFASHGIL